MDKLPAIRVRSNAETKTVSMVFAGFIESLDMTPEQTIKLVDCLTRHAQKLQPKKVLRGTRISPEWQPDAALLSWTAKNRPDINIPVTRDAFVDYWVGKPGKDGVKLDWAATWRNWCRNTKQGELPKQQPPPVEAVTENIGLCRKCQGSGFERIMQNGQPVVRRCVDHDILPVAEPDDTEPETKAKVFQIFTRKAPEEREPKEKLERAIQ